MSENYVVVTIKSWNIEAYERYKGSLPGQWTLVSSQEELTVEFLESINPKYIFFPHWSWIVSEEILDRWTCVCFHMTDVPYGRGGSPLQNLIVRGHKTTKLTALKMTTEIDAGPVYKKMDLDLSGSAEDIFVRASSVIAELIAYIVKNDPVPCDQTGDVVLFERRKQEQSSLAGINEINALYDHIRMLDAEGYPKAFLEIGNLTIEFSEAEFVEGELMARVKISGGEAD